MIYAGIDPGQEYSAIVQINDDLEVVDYKYIDNDLMLQALKDTIIRADHFAVERVRSRFCVVGNDTFDTCEWSIRFEMAIRRYRPECLLVSSNEVSRALSPNQQLSRHGINTLIIDYFGGRNKAIGGVRCKKCKGKGWVGRGRPTCPACNGGGWEHPPGRLAALRSENNRHLWEALAVAVAVRELKKGEVNVAE